MKTLRLTLGLPQHDSLRLNLHRAKENLEKRGGSFKCELHRNLLVANYVCRGWDKSPEDVVGHKWPENAFWDMEVEGLRLVNLVAIYSDALIPSPVRQKNGSGFEWRKGGSFWGVKTPDDIVLDCDPALKAVALSTNMRSGTPDERDLHRREFLEVEDRIERMIRQTRAALRLMLAVNSETANEGRTRRFATRLFLSIGR